MASYPTSVKAFTTKNDGSGNTIFAAHVNDLQDEVTAIEDGILNGTAPLHSSNTIVNNFSAAGGSTIAGVLNVAGASSFAGAVAITGTLQSSNSTVNHLSVAGKSTFAGDVLFNSTTITAPNQPRCSALSTATTTVNVTTTANLSLLREVYDVGGLHSTAASPSRMTIPAGSSGFYLCEGHALISTGSGGAMDFHLLRNSVAVATTEIITNAIVNQTARVSRHLFLDAADFVELQVQTFASSVVVGSVSSRYGPQLHVAKVW